jgi:hypothetical protein
MRTKLSTSAIAIAMGICGTTAFAAGTAFDTSANYTTSSWSTSAPNEGSGFGAWSFVDNNNSSTGPYAGVYQDLASYGNSDNVISGGSAWGTYANGGTGNGYIDISRAFTAGASGSTSLYNQTFGVALGSAGVGSGALLQVNVGTAFTFGYGSLASDNFVVGVDGNTTTTPVNYSELNGGLQISLAVSGALNSTTEGYTLSLSPFAGGAAFYTQSGTFDSSAFNTSGFTLVDQNTSGNGFFNNLNISPEAVPEPSTFALLGVSAMTVWRCRRRS